jgi:histidyl-tRNA synthetase
MLQASRPVPTAVLVAVDTEDTRATAIEVAERLRARGIPTEVAPRAEKFGRQIRYADRRRIPFVWFGGTVGGEVKDIRSGEQVAADPNSWMPSAEDLKPRVVSLA